MAANKEVLPIPLSTSSSPVGEDERGDLEMMLGVPIRDGWPPIRQCLRCLTQGRILDTVKAPTTVLGKPDVRISVRPCEPGELAARALAFHDRAWLVGQLALGKAWDEIPEDEWQALASSHASQLAALGRFTGRHAVRVVVALYRLDPAAGPVQAARSATSTVAAMKAREALDSYWAQVEAARAARRNES